MVASMTLLRPDSIFLAYFETAWSQNFFAWKPVNISFEIVWPFLKLSGLNPKKKKFDG